MQQLNQTTKVGNARIMNTNRSDDLRKEGIRAWIKGKMSLLEIPGAPELPHPGDEVLNNIERQGSADSFVSFLPSRKEIMALVRKDPALAANFVSENADLSQSHDVAYLEKVKNGYEVYYTDRGRKVNIKRFPQLWKAVDQLLKYRGFK